jgi:hypothetical protein
MIIIMMMVAAGSLRHAATVRPGPAPDRSPPMETPPLSPSERLTLLHVAEREHRDHGRELDWLALHRLKRLGFVEDRRAGPTITAEGRRALQRLLANA